MKPTASTSKLLMVLAIIGGATLLVSALLASPQPQTSQPATQSTPQSQALKPPPAVPTLSGVLLHDANFGAWQYYARKSNTDGGDGDIRIKPGQIYVYVDYNKTTDGMKRYVEANKKLLPQIASRDGEAEVYVVFNQYLSIDQFRSWVKSHGLRTGYSWARFIDETVSPRRIMMWPANQRLDPQDPINQADLDNAMKFYVIENHGTLMGVYATHTWVDARDLPALAAESTTFYIDVTPEAVRNDLAAAGIAGARQAAVVANAEYAFMLVEDTINPEPPPFTPTPPVVLPTQVPTPHLTP